MRIEENILNTLSDAKFWYLPCEQFLLRFPERETTANNR